MSAARFAPLLLLALATGFAVSVRPPPVLAEDEEVEDVEQDWVEKDLKMAAVIRSVADPKGFGPDELCWAQLPCWLAESHPGPDCPRAKGAHVLSTPDARRCREHLPGPGNRRPARL